MSRHASRCVPPIGRDVHVWPVWLEQPPTVRARLLPLLCADERERAGRFRFERDRSRYIVGRGVLRELLGRYLGLPAAHVPFRYGAFQKPFLDCPGPWFNLSHSGALALIGLSACAEIGIDVELSDADFARERIAERFFSSTEVAALRALPEALQPRAFLSCWTRKEAFLKARGDGLSLALDSFDVSLSPAKPAAVLRTAWSRQEPTEWTVRDVSGRGYVAAVAQRARGWDVQMLTITDTIKGLVPRQEDQ